MIDTEFQLATARQLLAGWNGCQLIPIGHTARAGYEALY